MVAGSNGALSSAVTASLIRSSNGIGGSIESCNRTEYILNRIPTYGKAWGAAYGEKGWVEKRQFLIGGDVLNSTSDIWQKWGCDM